MQTSVPLPDGARVLLRIPPESQNGQIFRLRGKGMPKLRGEKSERGSLYAEAVVRLPTGLSEGQKHAFKGFARELGALPEQD